MNCPGKACTACARFLPLARFSPNRKGLFGRVSHCKDCRTAYAAARREGMTPEQRHAENAAQHAKHAAKRNAYSRAWNKANPNKRRANQQRYASKNVEVYRAATRAWVRANLSRKLAHNQTRTRRVKQATPPWVDRAALLAIYLARPAGCEVDHVVPLIGLTPEGWPVCGLHVPCNLQYLSKLANRRKHRRMQP